jgi:hypothetical protein
MKAMYKKALSDMESKGLKFEVKLMHYKIKGENEYAIIFKTEKEAWDATYVLDEYELTYEQVEEYVLLYNVMI